ncbi:unnamed protein product [Gongylonema pulchrum]|uniref:WD_REPEATS_REGION domain-containing protein n=1 Tax=Gongylonema pulchrum TaxID=637853 RepID=A0A183DVL4_9BILA|nr:unnamed protein product [Gongylonema pulchrum]
MLFCLFCFVGITSMCLDRYGSTLFAASTDSRVYLYTVQGSSKHPSQLISVRFFIIFSPRSLLVIFFFFQTLYANIGSFS